MNEFNLNLYINEVNRQCKFALIAYNDLQKDLKALDDENKEIFKHMDKMSELTQKWHATRDTKYFYERIKAHNQITTTNIGSRLDIMDHLWYSIHSFVVAAGNISKLLWYSKTVWRKKGESDEDYDERKKKMAQQAK